MKAHLDCYLFLRTRTSRGTLKRTQDLGKKRHTLQPGRAVTKALIGRWIGRYKFLNVNASLVSSARLKESC